jgi:DNA-binding transcriptional MerR regulator
MSNEDLLSIGAFAVWTGLSINALRHYDEIGLLKPASVDLATGYRRYQRAQIRQAKLICALRAIDMPIDAVRKVLAAPDGQLRTTLLRIHRKQLLDQANALTQMVHTVDRYIEHGVTAMPDLKTPRICQVTINVTDLAAAITFYQAAFGATFNEDISSFEFGTWPCDDFFLLSVAHPPNHHGQHVGPAGTSRFGLLVSDVDEAHRRALDAGATERHSPIDTAWKPRSSCVIDPSGNWIDLTQA